MNKPSYLHSRLNRLPQTTAREGFVVTGEPLSTSRVEPMLIALQTIRLARRLGVGSTRAWSPDLLPYSEDNDNSVFDAPLTSFAVSSRIRFMRGWRQYQSCVKGFNGLGLIAELVLSDLERQSRWSLEESLAARRTFATTRRKPGLTGEDSLFAEAASLSKADLAAITSLDLAIWRVCANRTIVCSTSSNMGISLHEVLRYMQQARVVVAGCSLPLLNDDEGSLIIWCPDEEADFMNPEKTAHLRALEAEKPPLTALHTYINRRQRDPGALQDALVLGGYFFPTNPQSREELQNLLANSMRTLAESRGCSEGDLLGDEKVRQVLDTLGCRIEDERVIVTRGVESGMYGLMAAYLLMLEETLPLPDVLAVSTWNQASIGAALAAAVLADENLREDEKLAPDTRQALAEVLPATARWLSRHRLGKSVATRIHGVFDIANLQSLAQLLGVTVEHHLSGRGIAYVGLGSSSYANGNRCFDILRGSQEHGGPFHGKATFHPATHTANPIAQALVLAEDLYRLYRQRRSQGWDMGSIATEAPLRVRKPEPAGAAALAGYLLARLDNGSLSVAEIAYTLKLAGFGSLQFLAMAGYSADAKGANWFIQEASEEGKYMESLADALLHCLDMDIEELRALAADERSQSRANYRLAPLDPPSFEALEPIVNIYLTGDNTAQPSPELYSELLFEMAKNEGELGRLLRDAPSTLASQPADVPRAVPVPPLSHLDMLGCVRDIFTRNAQHVFISDTLGKQHLTYGQFHTLACAIAALLRSDGLAKGDRLALLLPNGTPLAATYFACMMTGIVAVPINPALSPREIGTILALAGAKRLMTAGSLANRLDEAPPASVLPRIQMASPAFPGYSPEPVLGEASLRLLEGLPPPKGWEPFSGVSADDLFLILFTSGTTALPKGVAHTIRSELGNAAAFNSVHGLDAQCNMLHIWPMAYSSGILNTFLSPFMAEGKVTLVAPFDARSPLTFWRAAMVEKVNALWLSPTMMAALTAIDRDPQGIDYCRHSIRLVCCGTAPLAHATRIAFEEKYGVKVMESYGLTETLILTTQAARAANRDHSVGTTLPGVELRIAPPKGEEEDSLGGEILASTPYMMEGYLDARTGEVEFLAPGTYFPTGDLGRFDAEGNLFITGRKKDLIIRGGQTISPASVREVLLGLPMIEDAAVVGVTSQFYGEEVGAAIILRPGQSLPAVLPAILAECRQRLHAGAVPSIVIDLPTLPLGSTGKVLGREVRLRLEAEMERRRSN